MRLLDLFCGAGGDGLSPCGLRCGGSGPLRQPLLLCGTMFGLETAQGSQLIRHRLFELSWGFEFSPSTCLHSGDTIGVYGSSGGTSKRDGKTGFGVEDRRDAMGIDWMTGKELVHAIPPAYTEYIGRKMMQHFNPD